MSRDALRQAAESLDAAADEAGDGTASDRLRDQSNQFAAIADGECDADHGKLARHEHILSELADEEPAVADHVETALESIRSYRATLDGV